MKASNKHIQKVLAYLKDKDDAISAAQYNTLLNRMNESQVFSTYMASLPEEERNEDVYYAARDAARFLAGKLPLSAVIPDSDDDNETEVDDTVTIKRSQLEDILKRLERLEKKVGIRKVDRIAILAHKTPDDLISRLEAIKWIGCGKSTIKRWSLSGAITQYTSGGNIYYSKSEIRKSLVYQDYKGKSYGNGQMENESRGNQTQAGGFEGAAE